MNLLRKRPILALAATLAWAAPAWCADEIHWTLLGPTSITFDWRGAETSVRYGLTSSYGRTATAAAPTPLPFSSAGPFRQARITGLQANTVYHYSVGTGPDHTFRTPPARGTSGFTVCAEGDIGDAASYSQVAGVQSLIAGQSPRFVLAVGDLTYGNVNGQAVVDNHFNDVMVWSQDAAYMPAWGNHEWDVPANDDLRNYKGRFDLPNPQTSPGSPAVSCCGEDWSWFDYGNVRFIAYPEPWTSGTWTDWQTRAGAIMDQAQADPAIKFIVTYGHQPAYSSGHHPGDPQLQAIMNGLGDTHSKYVLNLNGHSHDYERSFPQHGVVHLTVGTGGAALEQDGSCLWLQCQQPSWSAFRAMRHGPLVLNFTATSIQGQFLCSPAGGGTDDVNCTQGSIVDQFTIGAPPGDTTPPTVSITAPAPGASVSGNVTVSANASDNVGVTGVQFWLDGANLNAEDTSAPWTTNWNASAATPGTHALSAVARDAAGNTGTATPVNVTVTSSNQIITDPSLVFTEPQVPKPAYLSPFSDPTFHTQVTRIAGDIGAPTTPVSGTWGNDSRHTYQKQQPWNADGTLIVIENRSGSPDPIFLDGNTYRPVPGPCSGSIYDYRWHPSTAHAHELIDVDASGTRLQWFDVVACAQTRSWPLPITSNYGIGSGEGNPSNDGRYVAIASDTQMLIVDMDPQPPFAPYPNRRIGPPVTIAPNCGASDCTIDWVSVSASGRYAVVNYNGDFPRVFDINPQTLALTPHVYPAGTTECNGHDPANGYILDLGHADFALNPFDNNEDVLVGQASSGCPSSVNGQPLGGVQMVRLRDGAVTSLTDPSNEAFPHHISTRNLNRPGWAYVSYYPSPGQRFNDEIVAVKLDGSKACERVAHMHSDFNNCYRCEPHAVPSRDGQRVIFASTWSLNCGTVCGSQSDIKDYVVSYQSGPPVADIIPPAAIHDLTAQ